MTTDDIEHGDISRRRILEFIEGWVSKMSIDKGANRNLSDPAVDNWIKYNRLDWQPVSDEKPR